MTVFRDVFGTKEEPEGRLSHLVKAGKSDVFVYYSGHGAPDVKEKKGYFVPIDCTPNSVNRNGYPLDLLYNNISHCKARSTTVVIDACFSGGSDSGMLINAASPVGINITNPAAHWKNGALFTSSSKDEISSWYPEKKHGLFTYFFLKGMQGAADADRNGKVSAGELHSYLSDTTEGVPYWARRLFNGRDQNPSFLGDEGIDLRGKVQ
ncbi:MAG: caspase family protein [Candidatus Hatepunaea meridiana]|nr:caspase family protein [Candidatus Hatepunaea meridiana]